MFSILCTLAFCVIFFWAIKLLFEVTWGLAKILASVLFVLAIPVLIGCLLFASGLVLLLPVALVAIAWGILRACL